MVIVLALGLLGAAAPEAAVASGLPGNDGSFVLTAHGIGSRYAPTFTGNGLLGVRVPPAGQGYAGGTVPALSELAGFYAKPSKGKPSALVQQRANIPTWSTLSFSDGGRTFSPTSTARRTSGWRQSLDLRTGVISTSARWTGPDGHVTDIAYQVFTDRAREHVGVVQLVLRPQWTGTATVTDELDGIADRVTGPKLAPVLTRQGTKGWNLAARSDWESVRALGTGITAALADQLSVSANITSRSPATEIDASTDQSVGQRIAFPVTAGQTYTLTKYVGVEDSQDAADPVAAAQLDAAGAASAGYTALRAENDGAWAQMWDGRIDVRGNRTVASDVNASEFYLWSSARDDLDWSVSPAGLSSDGYDGHVFWGAETWMYPALLAQHPDLAAAMNRYRFKRLGAARQHARATGFQGARFPWESALNGSEQIPPPVSLNSQGLYEQHITADIALAQWQYFETTGDIPWLRAQGWPVISDAARFWASRVVRGARGSYHLLHVTGPDEENPDVDDEAFTDVGATTTLKDAMTAAKVLGESVPSSWAQIAAGLVVAVRGGIHPEYAGYRSQLVKQADVTLLPYPWRFPMSARVQQADLNFYVPRTDPGGPSMDDAVSSIDSSQLGSPGCSSFVYTQRSYEPFVRDTFDQFSETRTGGVFTFMTGIGGFLQEFLYGYSGLRWQTGAVRIAPSLTGQLSGVTARNLAWHGRRFTISIGLADTTVTLQSGAPLPVITPSGLRSVAAGHPLTIRTARPDLKPTADVVRCQPALASSAEPGAPPLAAVDGSPATDWQPMRLPATLIMPTQGGRRTINRAVITWGHLWPAAQRPNVHPAPGPVRTLRATSYVLQVSYDDFFWRTVARIDHVGGRGTDVLRFPPRAVAYVRLKETAGTTTIRTKTGAKITTETLAPMLQELSVSG
jgi:trehalose/maltose hydrolase-like predicted phosphorylase